MATQEKLLKSLESLKHLLNSNLSTDGAIRKKEKIQHCNFIAEAISTSTIKIAPNFSSLLGFTFEILLQLCDDPESDVRMIADESLNKIIRAMNSGNISKVQIELHKEIKRNGAARSLKAALWRFSQLAHQIRLHKGKPYVANSLPCFVKISERSEEMIHETLANSLPNIMKVLGCFTNDNDIKTLLKAFLKNISNPSTVIRRSTSSCILSVCLHCRKPYVILTYVLNNLTDMLIPPEENNPLILGVLGGLKIILPHIKKKEQQEIQGSFGIRKEVDKTPIAIDRLLQVYELCLFYLSSNDHNIVNAALETLNVLIQNCQPELKTVLLSQEGITQSRITSSDQPSEKENSPRQMSSLSTQTSQENLLAEAELSDTIRTDIEKWIDESKLSVINVNYVTETEKPTESVDSNFTGSDFHNVNASEYSNISIGNITDSYAESIRSDTVADNNIDKLIKSENSSEKSFYQSIEEKSSTTTITDMFYQDIDIGTFKDKNIPLIYCTRLIVKSFLLNGQPEGLLPDKKVRVSVKNLALTCLSSIFQIYPDVFLLYLSRNNSAKDKQLISDILLFENHPDPQLRGIIRILVASFIKAVLIDSEGDYKAWITKHAEISNSDVIEMQKMMKLILTGLEDDSSTCTRQSLISLVICIKHVVESQSSRLCVSVLNALPMLAKNPYWLVKVKLLEVISDLQYITIYHVTGDQEFQNKVIYNILLHLLKDDDQRVRVACSNAIVNIIPNLYFEQNVPNQSAVTSKAIYYKNVYLSELCCDEIETNISKKLFITGMPFPYNVCNEDKIGSIDFTLSRIIAKLNQFLLTTTSKHFIYGCIETLCLLSLKYPSTVYKSSWNCFKNYNIRQSNTVFQRSSSIVNNMSDILETSVSSSNDLLNIAVAKFMDTIAYDFNCHINLLKLAGNIFAGKCIQNLQLITVVTELESPKPLWDMFTDTNLQDLCEQFLNHVVKLLNIFCHIIDEIIPVIIPAKPTLPNLPPASSLSPLKRRKSDLDKSKLLSTGKLGDKDEKNEKKNDSIKSNGMGYFANIPHYMKIYELLRTAYLNYKVTLDTEASENLIGLLKTTLHTLSQILEVATLTETGRIAEEILYYLRSTFHLEPMYTVQCVHQLLKSLFGTNLSVNTDVLNFLCKATEKEEEADNEQGFYYNVSQKPYNDISCYINSLTQVNKIECSGDSTVMGYLHHKENKKPTAKGSDKILANYIRIFEPMVIESLKQYTITSNVKLQCEVLQLLSQLVQLRVNYCLLDSEQIFIGFVLKQFEFIEEGQMQLVAELIPKIFQFLVHLSYGKQHSKSIISVPKIIQLCDGLMASGQAPLTHCVPALEPIVEDIFLMRNKSNTTDFKELETTREVLLSMMLRLLEYHQVVDLLVLVLNESKYCDNTEKWGRWSKQIFDVLITMLKHNKIRLDDRKCLTSLMKLIQVLNPQVFKPINEVLIILFQESPYLQDSLHSINRWLGKVIILILILMQIKEEILLIKISECLKDFSPRSIFENVTISPDPLNVNNAVSLFDGMSSEIIFLRLIFHVIDLVCKKCLEIAKNEENDFLVKQLSHFLMMCLYIFQSGSHCKITNVAIKVMQDGSKHKDKIEVDTINNNFLKFAFFFPILTFKWCYFLTVLNYNNRKFWASIININETYGIIRHIKEPALNYEPHCINFEIVRMGGTIAFCEYLTENVSDAEQLSWFLINGIELIISLCEEPPVAELLSSIHRSSAASGLVIQAISSKCLENVEPVFLAKILKSIENVHSLQSGNLLNLLIPRFINLEQLAVSRMAANVASRKIEYLLTLSMEEVNNQLPKEDLIAIMESLIAMKLTKKNEALVNLLNKLSTQFYDLSPLELDQRRAINPEYIKKLQINKTWYMNQIKTKCHLISYGPEVAELLSILEYDDLISIMSSKDFNRLILKDCISFCMNCDIAVVKDEPQLLKASVNILLKDVAYVKNLLPKPHQVYRPSERECTHSEQKYSHRLSELFMDESFWTYISNLISPLTSYVESLKAFPNLKIPDNNSEDVIKFCVVCLESVNYIISVKRPHVNINFIDSVLTCANIILRNNNFNNALSLNTHITWLCSAVNSIYKLISYALLNSEPLPSLPKNNLKNSAIQNADAICAGHACYQLSVLISWLEKSQKIAVDIPNYLVLNVKSIIVSLSRQLHVNSYVLTPPSAWKNRWTTELTGTFFTNVLPLPVEYLQDIEILEEFIYRHMMLGWISRQQFEETWMCLLSVLNANPSDTNIPEEINNFTHATSLAIKAITSLLLLTLYDPQPGNKNNSELIHVSRDTTIEDTCASVRKLKIIQERFERKFKESSRLLKNNESVINVFNKANLEKHNSGYSCGQISVKYLLIASKIVKVNENENSVEAKLYRNRERILEESGLDLNSCLQFLLDLYSQWIKSLPATPLRILNEIVKSILIISDLFVEKSQFIWMLETCLELSRMHVIEDDIVHQYLIICVCKAASIIIPDVETFDSVKKILTQGLKSAFLPARIGSLHGILYLLQGCVLANTVIGGISDEMQLFLPIAVEYIQCHLVSNNGVLNQSQNHTLLLWSIAFFITENVSENFLDSGFTLMVVQAALTLLSLQKHAIVIHNAVLKGLERLVIKKCISEKLCDQIMKLSLDKMKENNPVYALPAVQLLISCMYTECSDQLENTEKSNGVVQSNPDHLVQTIEKVSAIFDKIKKGYPFEVEILCHILPNILNDFFPPSDILTKVVGEFLSPQQRHSKLLSRVLFQVFDSAIQQSQLSLLQDWVVFSLTNFTQSFSIGMATWCLTCFFISASTNSWLRSVFPYVQSRIGRYEYEDRKMLCVAGVDFYKNLTTDKQRQTFIDSFQKVKEDPDMPFNDLLASL